MFVTLWIIIYVSVRSTEYGYGYLCMMDILLSEPHFSVEHVSLLIYKLFPNSLLDYQKIMGIGINHPRPYDLETEPPVILLIYILSISS